MIGLFEILAALNITALLALYILVRDKIDTYESIHLQIPHDFIDNKIESLKHDLHVISKKIDALPKKRGIKKGSRNEKVRKNDKS